jgi:hypothetical protein
MRRLSNLHRCIHWMATASLLLLFSLPAWSQNQSQTVTPKPIASGVRWSELPPQKQRSLLPLRDIWHRLSEPHQKKWLELAKNFDKMSPQEQHQLHSRMFDWTVLNPKDRDLARLNFAKTPTMTSEQRAANWEAYQALSDEDKLYLAQKAQKKKLKSGAIAIKPIPQRELVVPPRRIPPESIAALLKLEYPVHSNTLLPAP